jgi:hypothetical protein
MSNQICYNCSKYPNYSIYKYKCVCYNKRSCNICKNCTKCVYNDICKKKKRIKQLFAVLLLLIFIMSYF